MVLSLSLILYLHKIALNEHTPKLPQKNLLQYKPKILNIPLTPPYFFMLLILKFSNILKSSNNASGSVTNW